MSTRAEQQALDVSAPRAGTITQVTMAAATASAAQDTGILTTPTAPTAYVSLLATAEFYVVFDSASGMAAPVVGANSAWGPLAAGQTHDFRPDVLGRYFRVISTPGGSLVWRISSGSGA